MFIFYRRAKMGVFRFHPSNGSFFCVSFIGRSLLETFIYFKSQWRLSILNGETCNQFSY